MNPEADNDETGLPPMPSNEQIIDWLEQQFPQEVLLGSSIVQRDGKMIQEKQMGMVKFLGASRSQESRINGRHKFLKKHILLEITIEGYVFNGGRHVFGPFSRNACTGLFAYDGNQLTPLDDAERAKHLGEIFRAEAVPLDQVDPHELARFFNEVVGGWHQRVVSCSAYERKQQFSQHQASCDESKSTVAEPSVVGNNEDGWTAHFWALRNIDGGCTNFPLPKLFEYTFSISPQFEIIYEESNNDLESKYVSAWKNWEENGVRYGDPRSDYNDEEMESLIAAVLDDYVGTRAEAIEALRELNTMSKCRGQESNADLAVTSLITCLRDKDKFDCVGFSFKTLESQLVNTLSQILKSSKSDKALLRPAGSELIPYLLNKHLRYTTILALQHIRPDPSMVPAIIELIEMLRKRDRSEYGRCTISGDSVYDADWIDLIHLLTLSEPPAQTAVPFLEELIASDADHVTKQKASAALRSIQSALCASKDADSL